MIDLLHRRHGRAIAAALAISLALAGCGGGGQVLPSVPVQISVKLPDEIKTIVDDASSIISKAETLTAAVPSIAPLVDQAKGLVSSLNSGSGDKTSIVKTLVGVLGSVAGLLPPPYGTIAVAVQTLLPLIGGAVGLRMAARPTGMTAEQARAVLRS